MIRKVLVMPNAGKDPGLSATKSAVSVLSSAGIVPYLSEEFRSSIGASAAFYRKGSAPEDADMILVLGGDGSVLRQVQTALRMDIPILGVNLGRFGFLNDLEPDHLDDLAKLASGAYSEKTRTTLRVAITREGVRQELDFFPLNDVVLSGGGHLADMQLEQCGMCAVDYRADGMIVGTPSGSTAYTLSAGGPIIDDRIDALCVTPICPRSFFARSILFSPDDVLRISNLSDRGVRLSVIADGRECGFLLRGDSIEIGRSPKRLRMIVFEPHATMRVLQRKMNMQNF